jgi:hypothetical protein
MQRSAMQCNAMQCNEDVSRNACGMLQASCGAIGLRLDILLISHCWHLLGKCSPLLTAKVAIGAG